MLVAVCDAVPTWSLHMFTVVCLLSGDVTVISVDNRQGIYETETELITSE